MEYLEGSNLLSVKTSKQIHLSISKMRTETEINQRDFSTVCSDRRALSLALSDFTLFI